MTELRDAAKVHQSLFEKAKILHTDILENNIFTTEPQRADSFTGMLIDLDLAIVNGERTGGRQMSGKNWLLGRRNLVVGRRAH